ncbi:MAG TPA: hypothetical protein V6D02_07990, partial [Candidatus Obscuribacterales bacterium]
MPGQTSLWITGSAFGRSRVVPSVNKSGGEWWGYSARSASSSQRSVAVSIAWLRVASFSES